MILDKIINLVVKGRPIPQSRPRFNRRTGGVYYLKGSVKYRDELAAQFAEQWADQGEPDISMPVGIKLDIYGLKTGADADNTEKQINDALVDAGILKSDDWQSMPYVSRTCHYSEFPRVELIIYEWSFI